MIQVTLRLMITTLGVPFALALASCKPFQKGGKDGAEDGDDSILAAVGGISDEDIKRGLIYQLKCKDGAGKDRAVKDGTIVENTKIRFAKAADIVSTDKCALEVSVKDPGAEAFKSWQWFGYAGDQLVKGLMYGSDIGTVEADRKLKLRLYKLYATPGDFTVKLRVTFPAKAPDSASATLACGGEDTTAGKLVKEAEDKTDSERTFVLEGMSTNLLLGKSCEAINVLVDKVIAFELKDIKDLSLKSVVAGKTYTFPPSGRYALKVVTAPAGDGGGGGNPGDLVPEVADAGLCLKLDTKKRVCEDRRSVTLPNLQYAVLRVVGIRNGGRGERVAFMVTSAAGGHKLGRMPKGVIKTQDLTAAAIPKAGAAPLYNFYKDFKFDEVLKGKDLSLDVVTGNLLEGQRVPASDLAGVEFLDIDGYWLHGFEKVTDLAALDKLKDATWMTKVTASKDGQKSQEFVVTGTRKYFESGTRAKVGGAETYFDWAMLSAEMAKGQSDKWTVYALSDKLMVPPTCKDATWAFYHDWVGSRNKSELEGKTAIAKLDGCEVKGATWKLDATGWKAAVEHFALGWSAAK